MTPSLYLEFNISLLKVDETLMGIVFLFFVGIFIEANRISIAITTKPKIM